MARVRISDGWVIHLFALLHAAVALGCRAFGMSDEIALTLLTMLLVVLICLLGFIGLFGAAGSVTREQMRDGFRYNYGGRGAGSEAADAAGAPASSWSTSWALPSARGSRCC